MPPRHQLQEVNGQAGRAIYAHFQPALAGRDAMTAWRTMRLAHRLEAEPCGARSERRCGVMTAVPTAACNIPPRRVCVANAASLKAVKSESAALEYRPPYVMRTQHFPARLSCFKGGYRTMRNAITQLPNSGCAPAVQPFGAGKLGMTIDEAADCTGIGRNTLL